MATLNTSDVNPLPPGWDCKFDSLTGKRYYINYFTRHTSVEDPRVQQLEAIPLQDMSCNTRLGLMMGTNSLKRQQSAVESQQTTELTVAKISAMFPTVSETHIRTLLLKYLKSVFPVVEETILLDTLSSADNNVHRATQTLLTMGFDKRATPPPRVSLQRPTTTVPTTTHPHTPPHRMKSVEEKQDMKVRLREKHPEAAERVVSIALDSVDYDESKANQILSMMADYNTPAHAGQGTASDVGQEETNEIIIEEPSQPSSPESPPDGSPSTNGHLSARSDGHQYWSANTRPAVGADPSRCRGPNQALLLPDYVAWTGRDVGLVRGPDPKQRGFPTPARGPDPTLCKGPNPSLAKGSTCSQPTPSESIDK